MSRPRLAELTPEAPAHVVVRIAEFLTRNYAGFGALEHGDYIGTACLAFYRAAARWTGLGCFGGYAFQCMRGAIRELRCREAEHQYGDTRRWKSAPPPKAALSSPAQPAGSNADGRSVSPLVSTPRYRRRSSRREHNQTYYYQHYEKHAQRDYQRHVKRLGARALPYAEWRERRERKRHLETVAA